MTVMKILFAGGGTAGHINPALAIAGYVREKNPDADILFVGNRGGMEETLVPKAGFKMEFITISGFRRSMSPSAVKHNFKTVQRTFSSSKEAKKIISEFKPDICVGTGGYVSGPVLRTAAKMGVPTIIHEQNAYPGVTNKMLAKSAKRVMLSALTAVRSCSRSEALSELRWSTRIWSVCSREAVRTDGISTSTATASTAAVSLI